MITDIYKTCMEIGNIFINKYANEKIKEWHGTEECATLTELTCRLMETLNISADTALDMVMNNVIENNYRLGRVTDHGWDDYTRGFLAGEILGMPTKDNLAKAEISEQLWDSDDGNEYGYYQEVLDEVTCCRRIYRELYTKVFVLEMSKDDYLLCEKYGFDFEKNFEEMVKDIAQQLREATI